MTNDGSEDGSEGMTYADAGVDIEASEAATAALVAQIGGGSGDYAGLLDIGDRYLGLATDGVGTKLLVAEALEDYSTVGIDCIAMNANDLVAAGVRPVAFVDYLAVDEPDERFAEQVGQGLNAGADEADIELVGGETAVMPEVINGLDLAGTCAGLADKDALFPGEAEPGDALVGFESSGIHSNGLTLARKTATSDGEYTDEWDGDEYDTVGEALLEPTRLYTYLLDDLRAAETNAAAHVTGGGWTNLERMGDYHYVVEDAFDPQPIFEFIQSMGGVSDEEMHKTFNMGTGFVAAVPEQNADALVESTDGKIIGYVENGEGVSIRGLEL
ncbi:phosphoribosylformylglycinamidine cyclo-ligase [Haloferax namakaokahaiae]|uniref:Phosphoribosylformylglycinamidine cyclo-ligase n=1 Tax=Haloferax namakaokahaiae TaxID=1748331 RepID=A0ABD5ZE99_9EURY